jgi:hypothetical protein
MALDDEGFEDTGTEGGAGQEFDWESDDNPYKKRFNDYRPEADRRATELAEKNTLIADLTSDDPDKRIQAADRLGLAWADEDNEPQTPDEVAALRAQVEAMGQKLTEREQRDAEQALAQNIDAKLESMGLDKEDGDWVLARAVTLPPREDGMPDLETAYQQLQARDEARFENWRKTKRVNVARRGSTGTENKAVHEMTDDERMEWAMAKHGVD